MTAILIQRCANGFLAARPDARDTSQAHIFPDSIATDSSQAVAFTQWLDVETRQTAPPDIKSELSEMKKVLGDPEPRPSVDQELPLP